MANKTNKKLVKDIMQNVKSEEKEISSAVFIEDNKLPEKEDKIENNPQTINDVTLSGDAKDNLETNQNTSIAETKEVDSKTRKKKGIKKPTKKISWKKRLFNLSVITVLGVVTGSVLGSWYFKTALTPQVDYSSYTDADIAKLQDNIDDILLTATGKANLSEADKKDWVTIAKSNEMSPEKLSPSQNAQLALFNITLADNYTAIGNGLVSTIASQTVYSERTFDGTNYQAISISLGTFAKVALKSTMQVDSDKVLHHTGNVISATEGSWENGKVENYTKKGFIEFAGGLPSSISSYIISSKTVLNENEIQTNKMQDENGKTLYKFTMPLHKVEGVLLYVRQMRMMSGLTSLPEFIDVENTFTIDEDWNLVQIDVKEHYTQIAMGVKATCEGTLSTTFKINEKEEEVWKSFLNLRLIHYFIFL